MKTKSTRIIMMHDPSYVEKESQAAYSLWKTDEEKSLEWMGFKREIVAEKFRLYGPNPNRNYSSNRNRCSQPRAHILHHLKFIHSHSTSFIYVVGPQSNNWTDFKLTFFSFTLLSFINREKRNKRFSFSALALFGFIWRYYFGHKCCTPNEW